MIAEFKEELKHLLEKQKEFIKSLKEKAEKVKETCYKVVDKEEKQVGYYNKNGQLVSTRIAFDDELQQPNFYSEARSGTDA
jgi:hypothetical protein